MLHLCLIVENGKGGYMKALKIDSAIFYFEMGKKIIKKVGLVILFTRRDAQVRVIQHILRFSRWHVQTSQANFVVFTARKLTSPFRMKYNSLLTEMTLAATLI